MSGHFHPKYRVNMRGRHVSRRCFVASATKLILPAFGSLTGGLDASHPEIVKQVGPFRFGPRPAFRPDSALPDRRLTDANIGECLQRESA
jgi:metallophosphoesterase superfamily enzyme